MRGPMMNDNLSFGNVWEWNSKAVMVRVFIICPDETDPDDRKCLVLATTDFPLYGNQIRSFMVGFTYSEKWRHVSAD